MVDEVTKLRRLGVPDEDIEVARELQRQQHRTGAPVQTLGTICGVWKPRKRRQPGESGPDELVGRQLRDKNAGQQGAALARIAALTLPSVLQKVEVRKIAHRLDEIFDKPLQREFDFMDGNVSLAHQYQDAIEDRLLKSGATPAQQSRALSILWTLTRFLKWQSYEVEVTAADIAERKHLDKTQVSKSLKLLEQVGAIRQELRGRRKVISITPEGVYRGKIENHTEVNAKYQLSVIDGGKKDGDEGQIDIEEAIAELPPAS